MLERELEPLDCPAEEMTIHLGSCSTIFPMTILATPKMGSRRPLYSRVLMCSGKKRCPRAAIVAKNTTNFFILFLNPFVLDFESSRFHSAEALNNLSHLLWKKMGTPPQLIQPEHREFSLRRNRRNPIRPVAPRLCSCTCPTSFRWAPTYSRYLNHSPKVEHPIESPVQYGNVNLNRERRAFWEHYLFPEPKISCRSWIVRLTARKLLFFFSLSALLIGCTKHQPAPSNSPTYTKPSLGADRSLNVKLDMNKLSEASLLYFVKSFGLSNNLVYRGTSPSKVTGTDSRIYALDESAVDSMALVPRDTRRHKRHPLCRL